MSIVIIKEIRMMARIVKIFDLQVVLFGFLSELVEVEM
jgi:hypothetical protein